MKKRVTPTQKKLAIALEEKRELEARLSDQIKETKTLNKRLSDQDQIAENVYEVLITALGTYRNSNDFYHRESNIRGERQTTLSLAISAAIKLAEHNGKEKERDTLLKEARLDTIDIKEERKSIIRLAVEQPNIFTIVTNPNTGILEVYSKEQGGRSIL